MGDGVTPVGDQIGTSLFIIGAEFALGVADAADWNGRDKLDAEGRVEVTPLLCRRPTSIAGEAAARGTGGSTGEISRLDV